MKNSLFLVLRHKWYDMITSGEKTEEYREITPYWVRRLFKERKYYKAKEMQNIKRLSSIYLAKDTSRRVLKTFLSMDQMRPKFKTVTFQRAYPKNPPRTTFKIESITVGKGKPEWGAEPDKEYFVLKLSPLV